MAGATLLTADDDVLPDCVTLRLDEEPDTLRLDEEPETLRLDEEPETLRLDDEAPTLRLDDEAPTLRLDDEAPTLRLDDEATLRSELELTDLEATEFDVERLTERSLLEPDIATRPVVLRLRFLSHPPPLTLRLGV